MTVHREPAAHARSDPTIIEQRRSLFRLRLTAFLGFVLTIGSAAALVILLGVGTDDADNRVTQNLRVFAHCPDEISAEVSLAPGEKRLFLILRPTVAARKRLTPNGLPGRNHLFRAFFGACSLELTTEHELAAAYLGTPSGFVGEDGPDDAVPVMTTVLENGTRQWRVELPEGQPDWMGALELEPAQFFAVDGYGRFHIGLDITIQNAQSVETLETSIILHGSEHAAETVRPTPARISLGEVEAYHFDAAPATSDDMFIDESYFIAYSDPAARQAREAFLILASTLFGAGISALLEALLAGGVGVLVARRVD